MLEKMNYKFQNSKTDSEHLAYYVQHDYDTVHYHYSIGRCSQKVYESYCWLWRNSAYRVSHLLEQYEGQAITDDLYELVKPYFDKVILDFFIK